MGRNRDSDLLDESNWDCAELTFTERCGDESVESGWEIHRFGHWACGWLEIIIVDTESPALDVALEIRAALEDYPALDESDFSNREYTASCENIESIAGRFADDLPQGWAKQVLGWLWDHNEQQCEPVDGDGAWPEESACLTAMAALGLL